ncbi:MAG: glycosyltransferase [Gallionella sp.]|nr:glycosyltransferase [Gallionella sp.]
MKIDAIHQFHPCCDAGDGITNGMLYAQRILRSLGYESEIYCDHIPRALNRIIKPSANFCDTSGQILLVHHSLGYENDAWLHRLKTPKVLVYHNITPEHLLPAEGPLRFLSRLGREQLGRWKDGFAGAIGDSELNSAELCENGYATPVILPLLVDCERVLSAPWITPNLHPNPASGGIGAGHDETFNILFVGRICENKRQDLLLDIYAEFCHFFTRPSRLILAGGATSSSFAETLRAKAAALGIADAVEMPGKVTDEELYGYYREADVFVCMSEHEGFGMPLIEAMLFDVPVVAYAAGNVPDTMGEGGLLVDSQEPARIAALLHLIATEPGLRRRMIAGQRANLQRFAYPGVRCQLADFLKSLGVENVPVMPEKTAPAQPYWRIEGPFDSSYSLAVVNRHLADALQQRGYDVGLRSMEGSGDFPPDTNFLAAHPTSARMAERAGKPDIPEVSLRFCYPPRTGGMLGVVRAMHSYGWEESAFPPQYVEWFNSKLDLVTVLSPLVEKILRDSGVRVPMAVVGGGADHLVNVKLAKRFVRHLSRLRERVGERGGHSEPNYHGRLFAKPIDLPQPLDRDLGSKRFRFLHVSSCFPRKGVDALLAAYGKAFRATEDVALVIKTFPNPHNDVPRQLAELRTSDPAYPEVVLINEDIPDTELVSLYRACHAFVLPSRAEGLGLPAAEAMLFGLPVIATGWGGQTSFCTEETAWLCDYRFAAARTHLGIEHSAWAEPDVGDLARLLREVRFADQSALDKRTSAARERVLADFTWARVAEKTEQAVAAVQAMPMLREEPHIGWLTTWNTRCGIAAYSAHLCAALPTDRLTILANRSASLNGEDQENVVRCWNASSEETLDDLCSEVLARGIGALVIQYNFGFFGLPVLARLIERMKAAGVAVHCFFHATTDVYHGAELRTLSDISAPLGQADRLYVHGLDDLNRLKGFGLVDNVVYFPHGVYDQPPADVEALKAARGLSGQRIVASYGFLLPPKGLQALIRAVAGLKDIHLLLVNALYPIPDSAQEKFACENLIAELGMNDRVTLVTDYLPDAESLNWLQMADLIVFPYQYTQESSSAAVRMGIAARRPVAVTPLPIFGDVEEIVQTLPGTAPEQIAAGIAALLADPALLASKEARATSWREARRWPLLSARLLNLIDGLANPLPRSYE